MVNAVTNKAQQLRSAIFWSIAFALLLWLIKLVEHVLGIDLAQYGVNPRVVQGLQGVLWAPLIHGSWSHLLANTGPVILLGTTLLYGYPKSAMRIIPVIYLGVGLIVWVFARESYHIGASGLTFGVMFYIFTIGLLRRDKQAMVLSLVVLLLYGGMFGGLLSNDPGVSFESHLAGAGLGVFLAVLLRHIDPLPPVKKYSWEDEEDEQVDIFEGEWETSDREDTVEKHTIH